jgi:hypothetical protein
MDGIGRGLIWDTIPEFPGETEEKDERAETG